MIVESCQGFLSLLQLRNICLVALCNVHCAMCIWVTFLSKHKLDCAWTNHCYKEDVVRMFFDRLVSFPLCSTKQKKATDLDLHSHKFSTAFMC